MTQRREQLQRAVRHLRHNDSVMRDAIRQVGPVEFRLRRDRFAALVRSIIGQQVSGHAARAIYARLEERLAPSKISAAMLDTLSQDDLRSVGLSKQKAAYVQALASATLCGEVRLNRLGRLADEQVIAELTKVKGIGRWTAEMLLIFSLGRLDVLPCDDLGIRNAMRKLYDLDDLPDRKTCEQIAEPWRPYASIASWYCWRSLELPV